MKAVRIHSFGGPDTVRVEDIEQPQPRPGEALVRVKAAGANPVDWMVRERIYNPEGMTHLPLTLGQDFSGVIERIVPASGQPTNLREGDEVLGEAWGTFAELVTVPVEHLVPKPGSIDFEVAASIPMPALTAWGMVIETAQAKPGMTFLIHGASGAVGSFAAQLAKWKGADVIATASPPSFEFLRSIGVDRIIDYTSQRFEDETRDVDVVIEHLGGQVQARSLPVLKKGGLLINLIGEVDQELVDKLGVRAVMFEMRYDPAILAQVARLLDQGALKPHISQVLPLEEARKALDLIQKGHAHGKVILKPAPGSRESRERSG